MVTQHEMIRSSISIQKASICLLNSFLTLKFCVTLTTVFELVSRRNAIYEWNADAFICQPARSHKLRMAANKNQLKKKKKAIFIGSRSVHTNSRILLVNSKNIC